MLSLDLLKLLQLIKEITRYIAPVIHLQILRSATFFHNEIAETEKLLLFMTVQTS